MEVAESSVELEDLKTASQHSLHKNKADTVSKGSTSAEVTTQDLLRMFGHNEEILQYYLGLKEAVIESRRRGEVCWCDPREAQMKEKLAATGWKPRIIFKLPPEQQEGCDPDGVEYSSKQVALDEDGPEDDDAAADTRQEASDDRRKMETDKRSFTCDLGGCKQTFTSLASYESHYHTCHNYVCGTCRSSFISAFILDVHLEENHDSYFQVLSSRTDMFRCLVESCSLKFRTPDLRKDHLVKVHKLPANFMFHKPMKTKSKKKKAALKPQSTLSGTESNDMDVVDELQSSNMECDTGRTKNHRKGKKMPQAFCFGRGAHKAFSHRPLGRGRHWHQLGSTDMDTAVDIEKVDFTDMVESLECS